MEKFCSNCGNQLREGANFCNKCGTKVNNTVQENQESSDEVTYKKACELMNGDQQSCEKAIKEFESLNGFKDSENKIEECNQKINKLKNNIYYLACELMKGDQQSCEKAIKEFESLRGFKDSEEKIKECKSNIKQTQYDKACSLMFGSQMNYLTAIDLFKSLKDFKDSVDKIKECEKAIRNIYSESKLEIYNSACELMHSQKDGNSENKDKSENFFDKILSFLDKYNKVNRDLSNYKQAIVEFNSIRNFKDSEAKIEECEKIIEKLRLLKQQYIQKFENAFLVILLIGIIIYSSFIFIKPYYYRNTFDNILNNGKYNEISILSFDKNFLEYSDDEQKKKVINYFINNTEAKYEIFDNPTFKKANDSTLGQKVIDSILKTFKPQNDIENRYKLLENPNFEKYGNKSIAEEQLRIIAVDITSKNIQSKYEFLEKNCFKKYGNENLAKAVVDSIYLDVLGLGIDEKLAYLKLPSTKPYISESQRKELIKSLFNGLIFNFLNDSQLDDFLLEICNKDELEQVKDIINERKNNLPKTFMNWLVKITLSSNKSPNLSVLNEYIKNNESAKNFISAMASDLLRSNINYDSYKPDDIASIVESYPWVFNQEVKDLVEKWKFAIEGIKKAENEYAYGGYSRIESLKRERSELPNFFILSGYIHKYVTYANGMEAYLISADGYGSAYLYTTKTSYSTTGRFSLYAQIMDDIPYSMKERLRNSGIYYVFAEVEEYYYTKNSNKYKELTNDIIRLENAAKEYENAKTKATEALRKVKEKLLNSL